MDHTELRIVGLDGIASIQKVEDALLCVPGVLRARVHPDHHTASVEHGETVTSQQLIDAVISAGYDAQLIA
ncbi:cation transporter [Faunimonas sp. B44]|uniref:cation transporter n=1 Tax=Faunimonas sp. B44 TaxID=3461493 RepID=UPI004044E86D